MNTVKGVLLLTRWKEYLLFVLPLTLLGPLLSNRADISVFDYRLYAVLIGNIATVAFAFMLNDVEDAEDDKFITAKLVKNPIASGALTKRTGYLLSMSVALVAFFAFYYIGGPVFWLGSANILLSYLYSSKFVRLKKWPIVDIASHAMMLGSMLILTSFYTYSSSLDTAGYLVAAAFFISSYGQIYNQLRDFIADKQARLKNTSILLGKKNALLLAKLSLVAGIICILIALSKGIIPWWFLIVAPIVAVFSFVFKTDKDLSDRKIEFKIGGVQQPGYFAMNAAILIWFVLSVISSSN